jgi:transmembrane protein DUF3566
MHVLKSVGVMSLAKIMGLLYGCIGLIFAPFFLLIGLAGSLAGQNKAPFAGVFGVVFAILMPVIYGVMGFVFGAIFAFIYNLLAKWVGGIELEVEARSSAPYAPYPLVPPAAPQS